MASNVDLLRSLTLGKAPQHKTKIVTIEGADFEVRSPTVKQRGEMLKLAGLKPSSDESEATSKIDMNKLMVLGLIFLVYDPVSGQRVFSAADEAALLEYPAGGWVDVLSAEAMKMFNVRKDDGDDPAKN